MRKDKKRIQVIEFVRRLWFSRGPRFVQIYVSVIALDL